MDLENCLSKPDNDCNSKIAQIIDEIFTIHVHPYSRRITSNIFWAHFHKENPMCYEERFYFTKLLKGYLRYIPTIT